MSYTGAVPDTEPARAWLTQVACAGAGDTMFPGTLPDEIDEAKAYCRRCPVITECRQWALDTQQEHGVWGGLDENERRHLKRQQARGTQPPPQTLAEAVHRRTTRTEDGHLHWSGTRHIQFQGKRYTGPQAAFIVGHGREPVGPVMRTCGDIDCAHPGHLSDAVIRDAAAVCGTRAGYLRHLKRGEDACDDCKRANAAADSRLRRTGTTLELAS